jgi:hypothetical protein
MSVHHYHEKPDGKLFLCGEPACSPSADTSVAPWQDVVDPDGVAHTVRPLSGSIQGFKKSEGRWFVVETPLPIVHA